MNYSGWSSQRCRGEKLESARYDASPSARVCGSFLGPLGVFLNLLRKGHPLARHVLRQLGQQAERAWLEEEQRGPPHRVVRQELRSPCSETAVQELIICA